MSTGQKLATPAAATPATTSRIESGDLPAMRKALQEASEAADHGDLTRAGKLLAALTRTVSDGLTQDEVLARAVALRESIDKRRRLRANRIALLSLFTAAGLTLAVLAAIPVRKVQILANVRASAVSLDGPSAWTFEDMPVREIDVTGIRTALVDGFPTAGRLELHGTSREAQLAVAGTGLLLSHLSIQSPVATLETQGPRSLNLKASPAEIAGEIAGPAGVRLRLTDVAAQGASQPLDEIEATHRGVVTFEGTPKSAVVNLQFQGDEPIVVARNARVSRIRFAGRDVEDLHSTVVSGTLTLSEFKADPISLQPGDALTLQAGQRLQVTKMLFDKEGLVVHLNGDVGSLRLNARELKPSLLAWATQHRGAVLFGGGLASVLSAAWLALTRLELLRT